MQPRPPESVSAIKHVRPEDLIKTKKDAGKKRSDPHTPGLINTELTGAQVLTNSCLSIAYLANWAARTAICREVEAAGI
jgi:hypothetical protein